MEINAAVAPTQRTRMQNNLGRIKPVVFAARQFWCKSSERKKGNLTGLGEFSGGNSTL